MQPAPSTMAAISPSPPATIQPALSTAAAVSYSPPAATGPTDSESPEAGKSYAELEI